MAEEKGFAESIRQHPKNGTRNFLSRKGTEELSIPSQLKTGKQTFQEGMMLVYHKELTAFFVTDSLMRISCR